MTEDNNTVFIFMTMILPHVESSVNLMWEETPRDPSGGVEVVGLGTNHRISLVQNPVLLAGQIAILFASSNRDVSRLRKRRQVAGREEVRAGDSESRAKFGQGRPRVKRTAAGQELVVRQLAGIRHVDEDVEVVAHEAIRQHLHAGKRRNAPKPFDEARLLLVIQKERTVGDAADQMAALVGLEVAQRPHSVLYTIISHNPTTRTPPLGSDPKSPSTFFVPCGCP